MQARDADRIGIDDPFWQYCQMRLAMETTNHPTNGLPPFGVDHRLVKSEVELKTIISQAEVYEKAYLVLCLADAKRTLKQAENRE